MAELLDMSKVDRPGGKAGKQVAHPVGAAAVVSSNKPAAINMTTSESGAKTVDLGSPPAPAQPAQEKAPEPAAATQPEPEPTPEPVAAAPAQPEPEPTPEPAAAAPDAPKTLSQELTDLRAEVKNLRENKDTDLAAAKTKLAEMETKMADMAEKAEEREDVIEGLQGELSAAQQMVAEIKASLPNPVALRQAVDGEETPAEEGAIAAGGGDDTGDIVAQFRAIKEPMLKTKFYREHKKEIEAALAAQATAAQE